MRHRSSLSKEFVLVTSAEITRKASENILNITELPTKGKGEFPGPKVFEQLRAADDEKSNLFLQVLVRKPPELQQMSDRIKLNLMRPKLEPQNTVAPRLGQQM